jgi:excisionase family DNA binding protein
MTTTTTPNIGPGALLTVDETARMLRISEATVRRLARRGELSAMRVGRQWRIDRESLGTAAGRNNHHTNGSR